jgi:hypothetical protein
MFMSSQSSQGDLAVAKTGPSWGQRLTAVLTLIVLAAVPPACSPPEELTAEEAKTAVEEASFATQVGALQAENAEISTSFTIGDGVEQAAKTLLAFWKSQAPCATVTLQGATVTTNWGSKGNGCLWRGKTWTGTTALTLLKNAQGDVQVRHDWTDYSDGLTSVTGTDLVTWASAVGQRQSVTSWTAVRVSGAQAGQTITGKGDVVHKLIDSAQGLAGGIQIDGVRTWTGSKGSWELRAKGVQVRAIDPVPQAGSYELINPDLKGLSLGFSRIDDDRIRVKVTFGKHSFSFTVRKVGSIEAAKS